MDYLSRAWLADALCKGTPTAWWEGARTRNPWVKYAEARQVCAACPVTDECLRDALQHEGDFAWFQAGHPPSALLDMAKRSRTHGRAYAVPSNMLTEQVRDRTGIHSRDDLYDVVEWMQNSGYGVRQVADYFGVTRRTAYRWMREARYDEQRGAM